MRGSLISAGDLLKILDLGMVYDLKYNVGPGRPILYHSDCCWLEEQRRRFGHKNLADENFVFDFGGNLGKIDFGDTLENILDDLDLDDDNASK